MVVLAQKEQKQKILPKNFHFVQDFLSHCTMVPDLLLQEYQQLGLTEQELVLLLRIIKANNGWGYFILADICGEFEASPGEAQSIINIFLDKGFVTPVDEGEEPHYNLDGLFGEMWEIWFYNKSCQREQGSTRRLGKTKEEQQLARLHQTFSKEFGRGLSPIENEKLAAWLFEDSFPLELILEALRRAVLQGKMTLSYIDSILLSWKKQNLRTLAEVEKGDRHPAAAKLPKLAAKREGTAGSEYSGIYNQFIIKK